MAWERNGARRIRIPASSSWRGYRPQPRERKLPTLRMSTNIDENPGVALPGKPGCKRILTLSLGDVKDTRWISFRSQRSFEAGRKDDAMDVGSGIRSARESSGLTQERAVVPLLRLVRKWAACCAAL